MKGHLDITAAHDAERTQSDKERHQDAPYDHDLHRDRPSSYSPHASFAYRVWRRRSTWDLLQGDLPVGVGTPARFKATLIA
jgi:hypothetical protein